MHIAVCDDDAYYVDLIQNYSREYLSKRGACFGGKGYTSAGELIRDKRNLNYYDLFLLDIEMPVKTGFDLAGVIRAECPEARIAFVTAYAMYAREGYRYGAVRYILKDMDILRTELEECLDDVLRQRRYADITETVRVGRDRRKIRVSDIVYYESRRNYIYVITKSGNEYVKDPLGIRLGRIGELMADKDFVRIHQSYLVNMRYIASFSFYSVLFSNGSRLPMSHSFAKEAAAAITNYHGRNIWTSSTRS